VWLPTISGTVATVHWQHQRYGSINKYYTYYMINKTSTK
jgi:hypothetical protein